MEFDSLKEIIEMAGHGGYVWSAYAIFFVTVIILIVVPMLRHKAILKRVANQESLSHKRTKENLERS